MPKKNKQKINLALVIPTLNEQYYIGKLLDSIAKQTVSPAEVVVVDAFSTDKTIKEIENRISDLPQLKYFQIPKQTVSKQRNIGVSKTKAPYILFLDADMYLQEENTLQLYFSEAIKRKADYAIAQILPISDSKLDNLMYDLCNLIPKLAKPLRPLATAMNLFIKRSVFEKSGGFDDSIRVAEDFEFVKRLKEHNARFVILNDPKVYNSVRRLIKVGRIKFLLLLVVSMIFIIIFGYRKNPVKYDFGNHPVTN